MTIYVKLPHEAVPVWAPVDADHVRDDVYRILGCRGEEEEMEFGVGMLVRCRREKRSGGEALVAFAISN